MFSEHKIATQVDFVKKIPRVGRFFLPFSWVMGPEQQSSTAFAFATIHLRYLRCWFIVVPNRNSENDPVPPRNFLGIPAENSQLATSPYVILPVPYEETATYGKGTQYGPAAIIAASQEVELFDEELAFEPYRVGIHTAATLQVTSAGTATQNRIVYERVREFAARKGARTTTSWRGALSQLRRSGFCGAAGTDARINWHARSHDGYIDQGPAAVGLSGGRRQHGTEQRNSQSGLRSLHQQGWSTLKKQMPCGACPRRLLAYQNPASGRQVHAGSWQATSLSFSLNLLVPIINLTVRGAGAGRLMWVSGLETSLGHRQMLSRCPNRPDCWWTWSTRR